MIELDCLPAISLSLSPLFVHLIHTVLSLSAYHQYRNSMKSLALQAQHCRILKGSYAVLIGYFYIFKESS
jgi:hypothetical protein